MDRVFLVDSLLFIFRREVKQPGMEQHGSLDSKLNEPDSSKELEIVREAFKKQISSLREKYKSLQEAKRKFEDKVALQSEALAQVRQRNEALESELKHRDDKLRSIDESIKDTSMKTQRVSFIAAYPLLLGENRNGGQIILYAA